MGPTPGWIGGWVPWRLVLLRADEVLVVASEVEAFPDGVHLSIQIRVHPTLWERLPNGHPGLMGFGSNDGILFGVGYADGRKAILGRGHPTSIDEDPPGPLLMPRGGGGGTAEWRMGVWLWPLPPPGDLTFVTAWPSQGISETSVTVDASELNAAASQAEHLWDIPPDLAHRRGRMVTGFSSAYGGGRVKRGKGTKPE